MATCARRQLARPRVLHRVRHDLREGTLTPLTIVTYHYVRDGAQVHARSLAELAAQLDHVAREYECVRLADVAPGGWPERACLLTFDDGLAEHLDAVAPELERRGLRGVFCVPGEPVIERRLLDVQKTQFLLAAVRDHARLADRVAELAEVEDVNTWREHNTPAHRFDPPDTVLVKRALQDGLPEQRRRMVLDRLFREHVSDNERSFADDLYLTLAGCRELVRRGHDIIGHGYAHRRLGLLDEAAQRTEIEQSRTLVTSVGGTWAFCYPYGSRDETTRRLLGECDCPLALTTECRRATTDDPLLELPRMDTNDLQLELDPYDSR